MTFVDLFVLPALAFKVFIQTPNRAVPAASVMRSDLNAHCNVA